MSGEECIVIAPAASAVKRKLPPDHVFRENIDGADGPVRSDISTDEIKQRLSYMGYERTAMIEGRGEFSLRGGILDIFTPDSELPFQDRAVRH